MNHSELKERIQNNLANANLEIEDLRLQPDFTGWIIVVVSSGFEGKSPEQRKNIVLVGLEDISIEWIELLTPAEKAWAGSLPIDSTPEDIQNLPLWPEALARSKNPQNVLFPSDLEEDLEPPIIATFYSLRGGVGRSTALAYTARILASRGRTVLCVDMDLEAPGLAALFGKEAEIMPGQGLLSILVALDQGERPDIRNHILRISETDELYCLPAGIPDANYARLLNLLDPAAWYREERNPLRELIQLLSNNLSFKPDVILLDARTGITPLNAPLLFDLADLAFIVFFPHAQTKTGTEALVRALLAAHTKRGRNLTPEPRFIVSPIPNSKIPEIVQRYQHTSLEWISDWLSGIDQNQVSGEKFVESEITHFIPYQEAVATSDGILLDREIWQKYEPIAEWLEGFLPRPSEQRQSASLSDSKKTILDELEFSAGTAEDQENFSETFVKTHLVNKAINPNIPLVLGRKGTGKTAIFRRLMEDSQQQSVVVLSPNGLRENRKWLIGIDAFKTIEKTLHSTGTSWREFWTIQTCLACHLSWTTQASQPDSRLADVLSQALDTELAIIDYINILLGRPQIGILSKDWLTRFDKDATNNTMLLFDGLDAGFGYEDADRLRRTNAIQGLLSLITDISDNLEKLRFKVVLREDIWRQLRFENKSHFFGRSVTLNWAEKPDFLKVVIKQALLSSAFKHIVALTNYGKLLLSSNNEDDWTETQVFEVWNLLVGERMQGGAKSAFTRNWIWNRLADGTDNRNPRSLLQLFKTATLIEKQEQQINPYEKTIIRPRSLRSSLDEVSTEALGALNEEFPELLELINKLRSLGSSPVKAREIQEFDQQLSLAKEVGLLAIYEGTEEDVQKYKIPDLYLKGIGMTRQEQG
ncbi:MAG: P-loop ATPase, Sll1717 family [Aphanizomenon sp.]|jgi:cellulose biosynthesis protein BcsQ/stress-induced morphogen